MTIPRSPFPGPEYLPSGFEHRDPKEAFENAIKAGRLSEDEDAPNYAGWYMYMGTQDGKDLFKHKQFRSYID